MKHIIKVWHYLWFVIVFSSPGQSYAGLQLFKPNWLAVSDPIELNRTWQSALVALPPVLGGESGYFLDKEITLNNLIQDKVKNRKLPLLLFIASCEGLAHHRGDIERLAKLGFVVIAPDSMARKHRPYGCYEDQEKYIKYYDIAIAFQKAELDYAVSRLQTFPWTNQQQFLFGSGTGGMVVAHYQGTEFTGHVIEGWGCNHPHQVFSGIWSPPEVRIYSVISKNDGWFKDVPGFEINCAKYLTDRASSMAIVLDRPAHFVSWYPGSRTKLIKFLTRDLDVNHTELMDSKPMILDSSNEGITLRVKWSVEDVYSKAVDYCKSLGKASHLVEETRQNIYKFACS